MAERRIRHRSLVVVAVAIMISVVAVLGTSCGSASSTKIFPPMVAPTPDPSGPAASPAPTPTPNETEPIGTDGLEQGAEQEGWVGPDRDRWAGGGNARSR